MEDPMNTLTPCSIRYAKNLTAIVTPKGEIQLSLHGVYDGLKPISVDLNEWKAIASSIVEATNNHARLMKENQAMREALEGAIESLEEYVRYQQERNPGIAEDDIIGIGDIRNATNALATGKETKP
jgi:hypothetical protein